MSFAFDCRGCGKPGEVPDSAVSPHAADDAGEDRVKVVLPPGWFADDDGVACLDCVEPDLLRAWVAEQVQVQELQRLWDGPPGSVAQ